MNVQKDVCTKKIRGMQGRNIRILQWVLLPIGCIS